MKIVFVRHSTAQDPIEVALDLERHLTKKGVKKFTKLMPDLEEIMQAETNKIQIWSSPAYRATETAEILQETLNIEEKTIKDFIYGGSFEGLLENLNEVSDDTLVFIVDHEPILSDWIRMLTQEDIRFKKASMVCVDFNQHDLTTSTILWEIHP